MKTISVEQMSGTPTLILCAVMFLTLLGAGILLVTKMRKNKHAFIVGGLTGVIAAAAVLGISLAGSAYTDSDNAANIKEAAAELGHPISEEQSIELKENGALVIDETHTLSFSDEGNDFTLTAYDDAANAEAQEEEDKKREQDITNGDY